MLGLHLGNFGERHVGVGEPLAIMGCGSSSLFVNSSVS